MIHIKLLPGVELKNLFERPEDNLVRAVVRAVAMCLHPDFRDELNPATPAQSKSDSRLKESDMRWKLPSHQNTKSDVEVHQRELNESNSVDELSSLDKE